MKRLYFILCIITFSFLLCSCRTVCLTAADELVSACWTVENPGGISAELSFNIDNSRACLKITDKSGEAAEIEGVYAIDGDSLYISSDTLSEVYSFKYKAFKDRLVLIYEQTELTLNAENKKEP